MADQRRSRWLFARTLALTSLCLLRAAVALPAAPVRPMATSFPAATGSVIVPVEPYAFVTERIAGDRVNVLTLVPPGRSPHTYSPTPQQIAAFAGADALFVAGLELERGLVPRLQALDHDLLIIDLHSAATPEAETRAPDVHGHDSGHDPHVWLDPRTVIRQAGLIASTLSEIDEQGAHIYAAGLDSLTHDLELLDAELRSRLRPRSGSRFYVFHPAFGHFAEAYGLEQVAVETNGKEPSAKRLAELVDMARRDRTRVVITQPQHSGATVLTLAREIDAAIVSVDPLAFDLFATLRALADAITSNAEDGRL